MALHRLLVTLHTVDANPENYVTNSWYFDDGEEDTLGTIEGFINSFYDDLDGYISPVIAQNGHEFQWYKMSDPTPRVPVRETAWNLAGAPAGTALPSEVAFCFSFQAPRVSGELQSRRRGRLYFGPLNSTVLSSGGRPSNTFINAVADAASIVMMESLVSTDWKWAVYSTVNHSGSEVQTGWVDNSFDTQRRRGLAWTSRVTLPTSV